MENTTNTLRPAPLWRQLMAMLYDSFLLLALSMAYGALCTLIYVAIFGKEQQEYMPMMQGPWFGLGWLATIMLFYCYFWNRGGQTAGMRSWRVKVVNDDEGGGEGEGTLPKPGQCAGRFVAALVSLFSFGLGYLWCLFDKKGASWHDHLSGTKTILLAKPRPK